MMIILLQRIRLCNTLTDIALVLNTVRLRTLSMGIHREPTMYTFMILKYYIDVCAKGCFWTC